MMAGHIEQVGTPEELYRQPATPAVAEFVGRSNRVPAMVAGGRAQALGASLPLLTPRTDGPAIAYIRPEHLRLGSAGAAAVVMESVFVGAVRRTRVEVEDGLSLWVEHDAALRPALGDRTRVEVTGEPVATGDVAGEPVATADAAGA
jgi:putative spermidine/putrescine transport system ATP-binding protein